MFLINSKDSLLPVPFYLKNGVAIKEWIKNSNGMKFWKNGNSLFYIPKSDDQNEIIHCLPTIDEIINSGNMIKQSRNRISIFLMNGKTYFGKAPRIYQYVWYKQIRYFFTPPRSLWSACVAQKIQEAQLPTPFVFAAGETRSKGRLLTSYLITEAENRESGLNYVLTTVDSKEALIDLFVKTSRSVEIMHNFGIGHEDLVPGNLYATQNTIGFWDLDYCMLFKDQTPIKYRVREYSMFLRTAIKMIANNKNIDFNKNLKKDLIHILVNPLSKLDQTSYKGLMNKFAN